MSSRPTFVLPNGGTLVDEPVRFTLAGLMPGQLVTITATVVGVASRTFAARATYEARPDGTVDPATQAPLRGSYAGVDSFGLWWSMSARPERPLGPGLAPLETSLTAEACGQVRASAVVSRARIGPGVRSQVLTEAGIVGTLFVPALRHGPGVVVLGGSEGGSSFAVEIAALLASRGLVALALAYFGAPGLPPCARSPSSTSPAPWAGWPGARRSPATASACWAPPGAGRRPSWSAHASRRSGRWWGSPPAR